MKSKLEESLAQQLALMGMDERWPFPAPIREHHFDWCCEHPKRFHKHLKMHWPLPEPHDWYAPYCDHEVCSQPWHSNPKRISKCVEEYRHGRAWRFDFAWPAEKVAVECDGGTRTGGRHVRPLGFEKDAEKLNAAAIQGWLVLRFTQRAITSGQALHDIESALKERTVA